MSRITVVNHVTLDGVMQGPASADEDTRGGFTHGGWAIPYNDEVMAKHMAKGMQKGGSILYGGSPTRTWPRSGPTNRTTRSPRYSTTPRSTWRRQTLTEPLPWENSVLLGGDAADAVAKLKEELDDDLTILGSGVLVRSLMKRNLIDEFVLTIHPIVLGSGQRLFDDGAEATLKLIESIPTTTGVIIATYQQA